MSERRISKVCPAGACRNDNKSNIEGIVDQVLNIKEKNPATDTSALEKEIDQLVYRLYDLTVEEVALIEKGMG